MIKKILRFFKITLTVLLALIFLGWLAFVPSASGPGYELVSTWGTSGSGPSEFNDPTGIAITDDEVFVSDARNNRIQVFNWDGVFKRQITKTGKNGEKLGRPMNLTIKNGLLYVPDYWNDQIDIFSTAGDWKKSIGSAGNEPGQMRSPGGLAVMDNGDLLIAGFYNQRIQKLNAGGTFIRQWGKTKKIGIGAEQFNYPTDVTIAPDGSIVIADGYNDRVQVFDKNGNFVRKWGGPFGVNIFGPFNGWFATVTDVDVDSNGLIYVADFYNDRIQVFDKNGTFINNFGKGTLDKAIGVAASRDGKTVFAVDYRGNRISKWQRNSE